MDIQIYHDKSVLLKNAIILKMIIEDTDIESVNMKMEQSFQDMIVKNNISNYGALFRSIHSLEECEVGVSRYRRNIAC